MKEKFISNIQVLRHENKISQLQLAKETGLTKSAIGYWEQGNRTPNAKAIIILSRYFQVSTDYLLNVNNDNSTIHRIDDFDVDMYTFIKRLKELRTQKNISQEQLSNAINISQPSIDHWELGINTPNANSVIALANFFGVTTDYLLGESN